LGMAIHGSSLFLQRLRRYSEEFVSAVVEWVPFCTGRLEGLPGLRSLALPGTGQLRSRGKGGLRIAVRHKKIDLAAVATPFIPSPLSVRFLFVCLSWYGKNGCPSARSGEAGAYP